ncbi:hypothetical protein E2986_03027 [Frieseomelitta varia]|uniref:Uncharacterized protein n=1 Tax=Frieseomelitta varia TaxID=561572 RepID=A0A833RQW3_9HYME|nr:hypothetical protein E2986_03027 [Frieseomelitta varia]
MVFLLVLELIVTDISVHEYTNLPKTATSWQFLDVNGISYLFRVEKSIFFVYKFDLDTAVVNDSVSFDLEGIILTFQVIDLHSGPDAVAVFCVESNDGTILSWHRLKNGNSLQFVQSWTVQKRIKDMKFIQHEKPYKILLLNDNELHPGLEDPFIDMFYNRFSIPRAFHVQICPTDEDILLAIQGRNDISLYKYKTTIEGSIFQYLQTIESYNLRNFVCFESGYLQFLSTSGPEAGLFHLVNGEFQFNTEAESNFDISEISWVTNVKLDTYRDESLLLIQLRNSTVIALAWQGLSFKRISLPSNVLDQLDLATITPLSKHGFIVDNRIVKFHVQLKNLKHPSQSTTERLLVLQSLLNFSKLRSGSDETPVQDTLNHQERILNETEARLEKSYLKNPEITGIWNISVANVTNATVSDNVTYHSVTIGGTNLTKEDLRLNVSDFRGRLTSLERKLDEIDSILMNAVEINPRSVSDVTIFGNIIVTGNLNVVNLTAQSINDINETTIADFVDNRDVTARSVNGIPIENIQFGDSVDDYSGVEFYKINRAQVNGNLSFSMINGIDWTILMRDIVWKNKRMHIPGETIIEGTLISNIFKLDILDNLLYPEDYVLENSVSSVVVTGSKSFDSMLVSQLEDVATINGIDYEDFVILHKDNVLEKSITFENLTIEGEFWIDGDISGFNMENALLLNETSAISPDVIFFNLNVLGNVTFDALLMNRRLLNLEDLLLKTDENVEITGTKIFLKNVGMKSNVTITSGMVNGHFLDEFVTLDTDQDFPHLTKILSNVTFRNVTFGAAKKFETFLDENTNSSSCLDRIVVFESPITVDQLSFDRLNEVSFKDFDRKLNETFENVSFENLTTEILLAEEITTKAINGIDFDTFTKRSEPLNIGSVEQLETDRLNVTFINGISVNEINLLKDRLNAIFDGICNGSMRLNSLQVTGMITTNSVNGELLTDLYSKDEINTVIFKSDTFIKNLTILGLMNGFNFSEHVSDTILKSDRNIAIDGYKIFDTILCHQLETSFLNGHPVENVLDPFKEQVLSGPVAVNGSVTVLEKFNTTGSIGDIPFYNLMDRFNRLGNSSYELHGDVRFLNNVTVNNLYTIGLIQGKNFDDFLNTIIFNIEDNLIISGTKVFQNSVIFNDRLVVRDKLNNIDLKRFQQKAIFIDQPFSVKSKIIFKDGIKIEKDLAVSRNLKTKSIMGIDANNLYDNVLILDKPNYIEGITTFTNVSFESDIQVGKFNDLDMKLLIPLNAEQIIKVLKCDNVTADQLQILGKVNDGNLQKIQDNTFMMTGNQNISGHFNFRGHVYVRGDFNARIINDIDPTNIIPLNSKSSINGNFIFERPILFNQSLRVLGYLNGIDPSRWEAVAFHSKWTVFGNVYFEKGASGSDMLNRVNITELSNALAKKHLEMNDVLGEKSMNLDSVCEDLRELKRYAEKQIYKFNAFDYLQIIEFDRDIVSAHYFELDNLDYITISYDSCHMRVYSFNGMKFELVNDISDFGVVEQWTTFKHDGVLYFLTSGRNSCGRSPHVLDFGHNVDGKKVYQDAFLMLINGKEQFQSSGRMNEELQKSLSSTTDDDNVQIILDKDKMLFTSKNVVDKYNVDHSTNITVDVRNAETLNFKTGIYEKDMFLYYDKEVSEDRIFICNNGTKWKKIVQTIKAHRPTSFTIINFDGLIETLLVFVENRKNLRIYEYKGIQGFLYRDSIRMNVDKLFTFKIRKYPNLAKRYCLGLAYGNRLTILEAKMYGEKLDMGPLTAYKTIELESTDIILYCVIHYTLYCN